VVLCAPALVALNGAHALIATKGAHALMRGDGLVKSARATGGFIKGVGVSKENCLSPWRQRP